MRYKLSQKDLEKVQTLIVGEIRDAAQQVDLRQSLLNDSKAILAKKKELQSEVVWSLPDTIFEFDGSMTHLSIAIADILRKNIVQQFTYLVLSRTGGRTHTVRQGACDCISYKTRGYCWVSKAGFPRNDDTLERDWYINDEKGVRHAAYRTA